MSNTSPDRKHKDPAEVTRGANEEAVGRAPDNVTKADGSSGRAVISGQSDGDTIGGPGANNEQGRSPGNDR